MQTHLDASTANQCANLNSHMECAKRKELRTAISSRRAFEKLLRKDKAMTPGAWFVLILIAIAYLGFGAAEIRDRRRK